MVGAMDDQIAALLADCSPEVRELATATRALVREVLHDAQEEVDTSARLIAYTYQPGTYKGLAAAIALHKSWVNLMFSKGAAMQANDPAGLLEGTGKLARHIKIRSLDRLADPGVRALLTLSRDFDA